MSQLKKHAFDAWSDHAEAPAEALVGMNTMWDQFNAGDLTALLLEHSAANDNGGLARNEEMVLDERIINSLLVVLALLVWCLPVIVN